MYPHILSRFWDFDLDRYYVISIDIAFALRYIDINNIKNRDKGFVRFIKSSNSATQINRL